MKHFAVILLSCSAGLLVGCGEDSTTSEDAPITSPFLVLSTLSPGENVTALTESEMLQALTSSSAAEDDSNNTATALVQDDTTSGDETSATLDCYSQSDDAVVEATGDSAHVGFQRDIASCLNNASKQENTEASSVKTTATKAIIKLYVAFTCSGGDLSALDGKKLSELEGIANPSEGCASFTSLLNLSVDMAANLQLDDKTATVTSVLSSFMGNGDGQGCVKHESATEITVDDGCTEIDSSSTGYTAEGQSEMNSDFSKFVSNGVKGAVNDGTYFAAGSKAFTLNNWTGTLTFTAEDTAPTYEATNGTASASGTYDPTALLRQTRKVASRNFRTMQSLWK